MTSRDNVEMTSTDHVEMTGTYCRDDRYCNTNVYLFTLFESNEYNVI